MNRRSSLAAGFSALAAASRRSKSVCIGLLAIAGALAPGDEAYGQVGVESEREVLEGFYDATGGSDWFYSQTSLRPWTEVTLMLSTASAAPLSSRMSKPFVSTL